MQNNPAGLCQALEQRAVCRRRERENKSVGAQRQFSASNSRWGKDWASLTHLKKKKILCLKDFLMAISGTFQGQQQLTNSVYFHLGRHMDAWIHEALRWVFFTIIRADVVGQEAEALWADFMNMTTFFAKTDATLCWWIICHIKPKTMISMWQETLQICDVFNNHKEKSCVPVSQVRGVYQNLQTLPSAEQTVVNFSRNTYSRCDEDNKHYSWFNMW